MNEEHLEFLSSRRYAYLLLQRLFAMPLDAEFVKRIDFDVAAYSFRRILGGACDYGSMAHEEVLAVIDKLRSERNDSDAFSSLDREYARCFVGPARLAAPPFESVYVDRRRVIMTETTLSVRATYEASGFRSNLCHHVPDDFLAYELDFMASLARRAYDCACDGREEVSIEYLKTSAKFLRDHLCVWVPMFLLDMEKSGESSFYAKLSGLLASTVEADRAELARLLP